MKYLASARSGWLQRSGNDSKALATTDAQAVSQVVESLICHLQDFFYLNQCAERAL